MKQLAALLIVAVSLTAVISGCVGQSTFTPADDSAATPEKTAAVVAANNQFAFDIYALMKDESASSQGNVFFSPYSIETALAMTYEGARGTTADEMQSVLRFPAEADVRQPGFARLYNLLNPQGKGYALSTANALWAQNGFTFLDEYFNTTSNYYAGKVTNLDFIAETEKSRQTINTWVEDRTNDKIKDLIPAGAITPATRLVLTNAIYFKGDWATKFDPADTRESDFIVSPNKTVKAQMMQMSDEEFNYSETEDVQMLELPYKGGDLSMLVLLPKGDLASLEASLSADKLADLQSIEHDAKPIIYMPKFTFDTKYFLANDLTKMGMPTAFTPEADFSGMTGSHDLFIGSVIHQAFVAVDEEGTEAAAATAVIMTMAYHEPLVFNADHPFIFLIQEKSTGAILFMGRVVDPSAQ